MERSPTVACLSAYVMHRARSKGKMLKRCEDTNLCLNWEKSHFMVKEGIVLGHKISKNRIEVDKSKVDVIAKLPHPTTVKGVWSFLGHADADVDNFKRCCTSYTFRTGYRVLRGFLLHRSSVYNSASLSNKFGGFYFIFKFGISGLLHQVVTAIADRIRELLEYMVVHVNDASESSKPSWGQTSTLDTLDVSLKDLDFTLSTDFSGSDLVVSFPSRNRNKTFDPGISIEVQSKRFLSLNKFSISFISDPLSLVIKTLLPFSSEIEDKVFSPGILVSKEEKSPHLLSHRGFKAFKIIHNFLNESPMMIYEGDIPI
ncbi:hypothetical protein Tco_0781569 [Tanacetum coccineum]